MRQKRGGLRRGHPARRHDRGARGGGPGRRHAEGGRLHQHRDERPHPVLPRGRPGERVRHPPLQAVPPGRPQAHPVGHPGRAERREGRHRLRRDGRGHPLGHRPDGLRPADLQHEPDLHPAGQEGPPVDRVPDGGADRRGGAEAPERPADRGVHHRGDPPPPPQVFLTGQPLEAAPEEIGSPPGIPGILPFRLSLADGERTPGSGPGRIGRSARSPDPAKYLEKALSRSSQHRPSGSLRGGADGRSADSAPCRSPLQHGDLRG